jgi:hypothetical protein
MAPADNLGPAGAGVADAVADVEGIEVLICAEYQLTAS